jgi:predicted nucleic acid-binding Zn finger protein
MNINVNKSKINYILVIVFRSRSKYLFWVCKGGEGNGCAGITVIIKSRLSLDVLSKANLTCIFLTI